MTEQHIEEPEVIDENAEEIVDQTLAEVESSTEEPEPDTFPRSYVEELRQENGRCRQRAHLGDQYAKRLHTELVRATGKLADPTDLPFDENHVDDPAALNAIEDLISHKPHLASRRPIGEIGQGASPSATAVDLAALLRQRAR